MAADLERLAREYSDSGQLGMADTLVGLAQVSRQLGIETFSQRGGAFTDNSKAALLKDGAVIYQLAGQTIEAQTGLQRKKGRPSFYSVVNGGNRLVGRPSRLSEVAIYPDPERFFVPNTGDKDLETQDVLVAEDARNLRIRLRVNWLDVVIPDEAATLTELTFKHFGKTGVWLFGAKYNYSRGQISALFQEREGPHRISHRGPSPAL